MQFVRYAGISSLAAIINLLVGFVLYSILGLATGVLYCLAVSMAYLTGMVVNWSLNRAITFPRSGRRKVSEFRTFFVVATIGLGLTIALASLFRSTLAPYLTPLVARALPDSVATVDATAHAIAIAVVAIYSFIGHKWLTFDRGIRYQISRLGRRVTRSVFWPYFQRTGQRGDT
jgi:putative flippase GtrA